MLMIYLHDRIKISILISLTTSQLYDPSTDTHRNCTTCVGPDSTIFKLHQYSNNLHILEAQVICNTFQNMEVPQFRLEIVRKPCFRPENMVLSGTSLCCTADLVTVPAPDFSLKSGGTLWGPPLRMTPPKMSGKA